MSIHRKYLTASVSVVIVLAGIKLLLHLLTSGNYGLFVDELYFLAAGQHLGWGYVDMPPLTAVLAWLARLIFADSVAGIHVIPALAGAGLVLINGWLVAELGGKVFAQALAGVCVISAGVFLTIYSYLSMNAVEPLIWVGGAALLARHGQDGQYTAVDLVWCAGGDWADEQEYDADVRGGDPGRAAPDPSQEIGFQPLVRSWRGDCAVDLFTEPGLDDPARIPDVGAAPEYP